MAEVIATYEARVRGLWNTAHEISGAEGRLGTLTIQRGAWGLVMGGKYVPVKGEVLLFRRDPGVLRSQFSCWTEGREWLGSALRANVLRREISLQTGNKPFRLVPLARFARGWRMLAPKTGEMARLTPGWSARRTKIEVFRRVDLELVLFSYFLGWQVYRESWWPGRVEDGDSETIPTPSKA